MKLIETILINGEVPPLTVVITDGIYEIIDGRQRYETILRFQNNEFSLKAAHLKKLKELDGLTFSQLPPNVRKIFEEYKIKMITYTPERGVSLEWKDIEKIKRDLFRKYNYGMTALSKSEVARAKYLYDDLTNKIRDYLIEHPEQYENYVSLLLPPSKQNLDEREKMNVLLMNVRELLSMPYIPIIGVKTVLTGSAAIEKYYERFVIKCDLTDKRDEFIKIMDKVYTIRERLARNQNPLQKNILFLKSLYWMLSILYQKFPSSFYHFEIDPFCHYIESRDNALDYFNYYRYVVVFKG